MDHRKEILTGIDRFYIECIEEFREAEARIAEDSKFRSMFRKKDYPGNIRILKHCKKVSNNIAFPVDDIPADDPESRQIVDQCRDSIHIFNRLCDSYISLQTALMKKSEGEDLSYGQYHEIYKTTKERHAMMNDSIRALDILYADYAEEGVDAGEGFLTYDMLVGGDKDK